MYNSISSSSVENGKEFHPLSKSDAFHSVYIGVLYLSCDPDIKLEFYKIY